jgi:hypothetical protein
MAIEICDAGLNMTIPPEMRDLADRLLAYEAFAAKTSEPGASATFRVYENLRHSLIAFSGIASFNSLVSRALALASSEAPSLSSARINEDGTLQGLAEFEPQIDIDRVQAGEFPAGEEGRVLIARLLSLLHIFLGQALTLSLLRNAWPGGAFDNRNSVHGRQRE